MNQGKNDVYVSPNNTTNPAQSQGASVTVNPPSSTTTGKEREAVKVVSVEAITGVSAELEIPKELKEVGVEQIKETIELPPDVKKLGVTPAGSAVPVTQVTPLPQVSLPISDQLVLSGLHAKVTSAFRWLAVWCIKRLKKAHIALKSVHGKIMRVKI